MTGRPLLASGDQPTGVESVLAVATGTRTVSDVAEAALNRVREVDGDVGAWRYIDDALVGRRAKEIDAQPGGSLRGLAVGVKDVIDTVDQPTGYGSELFDGHQPAADAEVVARLRAAGALVLGKTESTEFAMFRPTRTRNPADPERTPGGSSSGSAAAVAAGMVPVALGTQTAGSVVRPAAFCGVYGWKPALGWTPTDGVWRLAESLDTIGLFARHVADLSLLYHALCAGRAAPVGAAAAGTPPGLQRPSFGATRRRAAILPAGEWAEADDDVTTGLELVATRLSGAGWSVHEMRMPAAWKDLPGLQSTVMAAEVAYNLHLALGDRLGRLSPQALAIVDEGERVSARDYLAARRAAAEALAALPALAATVDLVLAPSSLGVAPVGLEATGDPVFCRPWTLLGLPAANVPAVTRADGLPVGVQALGLAADDLAFLDHLASLEAAVMEEQR